MSPTLVQAKDRRWWIAITSILENLMFAAVLLGWSSLLLMLKNEGFYANVCIEKDANETFSNTSMSTNTSIHIEAESNVTGHQHFRYPTCTAQDEILNRYFSIGSCLLSGVTVLLGIIMDKYGCRYMRLCGCITFMVSCVFFIVGSWNTEEYSILMAPAVCMNGMGGVVYVFTSFQVPNLFEDIRSTMISLMIGSYSASAIVYMVFKAFYDMGVSFQTLMTVHACLGALTFLNCYFNIPMEAFPGPDDISYAIRFHHREMRYDHKVSGKKFLIHSSSVGRRMSNVDVAPNESIMNLDTNNNEANAIMPFHKVLMTPCILWSFVTMCLTQLRLIAYMGWLELYFKAASEKNDYTEEEKIHTVEYYVRIFGLFQINCFFMAPIIGTIMDWKMKDCENELDTKSEIKKLENGDHKLLISNGNHTQENGHKDEKPLKKKEKVTRKLQQIRNLGRAFLTTNVLLMIFGVLILFEKCIPLQYISFILHTIIRTFLHSSMGGLYAVMYHFSHFGKLTGLASFLSAMFILIQDPLFLVANGPLGGDPFWINFVQFACSLLGFGLPVYLWMYGRSLVKQYKTEEENEEDDKAVEMKLMSIPEEEEFNEEKQTIISSQELHIGSSSTILTKTHLTRLVEDEPDVFSSLSAITF